MLLVPRGTPVHEQAWTDAFEPPGLLVRLRGRKLTGYARFTFPDALAIFLFQDGKLSDAAFEQGNRVVKDLDAITETFERLAGQGGNLDVYGLSPDLVDALRALLRGKVLFESQSLGLIDVKSLLGRLKTERLTGCLRVYTEDRTAMILYKQGSPIGFFHDGSPELQTSAAGYQNVAGLPGAKLDVFTTDGSGSRSFDLQDVVDFEKVWVTIRARHAAEIDQRSREAQQAHRREREARLGALVQRLEGIVASFLGKPGTQVFAKELGRLGGPEALLSERSGEALLLGLETAGKLLAGNSRTRQMLDSLEEELQRGLG